MINLGTVKPGRTLRIPFSTFDKDDGSSITMTNYAVADILIYKDGSTTERASTSGFGATTDFDSKTGKHLIVIDLADNTTADFFAAGSEYLVAIDAVTVDAVTTGGWVARFDIGYPGAILDTTIATLASQTSFTLTNGPAEDDALNGHFAIIHDAASAVQLARVLILDYTGSTKTVTLVAGASFTVAAKDNFSVMGMAPVQPTVIGRTLLVAADGSATAALDSASVTAVQAGLATSTALTAVGNNVTAILEDTGTTIPNQITALNNLSSAQVVSALGTGTWATALPWNAAWDAEVQSEVQDAIEVNNLDHLVKIAVDTNFATTVHLDSIIGHMSDNGTTATFSRSTDSLEAIRDNQTAGSGASLPDIIAGVQSVSGGIIAAQDEAALYITIGDTWTQDIDSLGDLTNKTLTFSIKTKLRDADTAAIVTIVEGTGLTRLNGAATTAGWGSITINDEVAGDITLRLESDATALLTSGTYIDAVKALEDGDDRTLRQRGRTVVSAGVIADIT